MCRLALADQAIDAGSFTLVRLLSGLVVLVFLLKISTLRSINLTDASSRLVTASNKVVAKGSWWSSFWLFLYAVTFSFAYISLDTGTGALILFGAVQLTMVVDSLYRGARLSLVEWLGLGLAFIGFVFLVAPTLTTPSLHGFVFMLISGLAWAFYSLRGRSSLSPLTDTTYNFLRTLPWSLGLLLLLLFAQNAGLVEVYFSAQGIMLAVLSGALASGVGYAIWYVALSGLSSSRAAVVQLLVPVMASFGGVVFAHEALTSRFMVSALLVLSGILMVILGRKIVYSPRGNS